MALLVKILLIAACYLPNNGSISSHLAYFYPNYFTIEIVSDSPEDNITENYISCFYKESKHEQGINVQLYNNGVVQKTATTPLQINFLYRLIPFLTNQPPPSYCES